jgi:hypothetical protein
MNKKQIIAKLRAILDRADVDSDGIINRKKSSRHEDEMEVLLEHVSLLVADLRLNVAATRNELFEVRFLLEE